MFTFSTVKIYVTSLGIVSFSLRGSVRIMIIYIRKLSLIDFKLYYVLRLCYRFMCSVPKVKDFIVFVS